VKGYFKTKLIEGDDQNNLDEYKKRIFQTLYELNMHRSLIKKCVMTVPYNTSAIQSIKYLRESFEIDMEETKIKNKINNDLEDQINNIEEEKDSEIVILENNLNLDKLNKNNKNKSTQL
jgi:hypothetical protein